MAEKLGSPRWWLDVLSAKLAARSIKLKTWDRYYRGDHPLPIVRDNIQRQDFASLLKMSKSNFCEVVVDATEERLNIDGFRVSATADVETDTRAWEIWQANSLDAESQVAHTEALVKSVCPVSVWMSPGDQYPRIVVEDPLEMIVAYQPGDRRTRAAALKVWADEWTGERFADVWLPDATYSFRSTSGGSRWVDAVPAGREDNANRNPLGVVPVVELRNRHRASQTTQSDLEVVIPSQDRINKLLFDLMLTSEVASFRQRWVTGLDITVDEHNRPVEPFRAAIDRLWQAENPEAKFGEFSATPLQPTIEAIEQSVLHIAVQTRTPRHYLLEQGQSPSGDAIKSAETGLVRKVIRKQRFFGEAWEDVMRLARRFDGATDDRPDAEVVWTNPESRSESEMVDAVTKRHAVGVPVRQLWEDLGYTQTQIARFSSMRLLDALESAVGQSTVEVSEET